MKFNLFRGVKCCGNTRANQLAIQFRTAQRPDRTELHREAREFIEIVKERRAREQEER